MGFASGRRTSESEKLSRNKESNSPARFTAAPYLVRVKVRV